MLLHWLYLFINKQTNKQTNWSGILKIGQTVISFWLDVALDRDNVKIDFVCVWIFLNLVVTHYNKCLWLCYYSSVKLLLKTKELFSINKRVVDFNKFTQIFILTWNITNLVPRLCYELDGKKRPIILYFYCFLVTLTRILFIHFLIASALFIFFCSALYSSIIDLKVKTSAAKFLTRSLTYITNALSMVIIQDSFLDPYYIFNHDGKKWANLIG